MFVLSLSSQRSIRVPPRAPVLVHPSVSHAPDQWSRSGPGDVNVARTEVGPYGGSRIVHHHARPEAVRAPRGPAAWLLAARQAGRWPTFGGGRKRGTLDLGGVSRTDDAPGVPTETRRHWHFPPPARPENVRQRRELPDGRTDGRTDRPTVCPQYTRSSVK